MMVEMSDGGSRGRDGGGSSVFRCRHQRDRMQQSKRWLKLTLFLLVLLCASFSLVSAVAPNTERTLLLYIPMHISEPLEHLQELCDCTLSKDPWVATESNGERERNIHLAFDILIVVSGPSEASRNATKLFAVIRPMIEAATENLLPSAPRIFIDYKALGVDKYNFNLDDEDKDAEWVSGPNSVFYDAFAEGGEIYEKYVRFYALVQQLETDVCALRGGWLSALLRPMLVGDGGASDSSLSSSYPSSSSLSSPFSPLSSSSLGLIILSGPTIRSSCMYVVKYDECQPFEGEASHMTEHVNGNAVYRIGEMLQLVLKASRDQFANAEPFDLAIYHVLKASNASSTLAHRNPLYHNTATLLDRDWFLDVRYHGVDDLAVLHAPRRLRADGLKAVATRAQTYFPATTVILSEDSIDKQRNGNDHASSSLLLNFKAAIVDLHLSGVIYVALTEEVFVEASRVVPLQVLPAFEMRQSGATSGGEAHSSSLEAAAANDSAFSRAADAAASAAAAAPGTSAVTAAAASAEPKSFVLTWPPTAPSPATRLLATITQLVMQGYSPLVVGAASAPLQNYDVVLYGLPKDAVFFAETTPSIGDGLRRPFNVKTDESGRILTVNVETMYAPTSAYTASFLQEWVMATLQRQLQEQEEGVAASRTAAALLSIADVKGLAACRLGNLSGFTPCPWRGMSVKTLPIHLFPPQVAFFGSGWTRRARKHALFLDMSSSGGDGGGVVDDGASSSSSSSTATIFRLRHAGKWHAPARCPTYSVLSRLPRDLTHDNIFDELTLHAEFLSFVRERKIACAVLPGFRLSSTSATLPVDALLDLKTMHASAGTQATILPRIQDVEEARKGYVVFDHRQSKQINSLLQHLRKQKTLPHDDLCSAFDLFARPSPPSPTACLARDISLALSEARSALSSPYVCALDARRTIEDVALVGLRGASRLAEVATKVEDEILRNDAGRASSRSPSDTTILLTGAWRLLPRGLFGNGVSSSSHSPSSPARAVIVTLSDLHMHGQKLQGAQELNPKASPLADEAWAGILEALLCRHSERSFDVSLQLSSHDLGKTPASRWKAGHRKNTHDHKSFAELVARHIPPAILLEDVGAFAKWLARPDRPNLVLGRSLQFLAGEGGGPNLSATAKASKAFSSQQHHRRLTVALQSLSMLARSIAETRADYAYLPAAADTTTGKLLPWSRVTEIAELYRVRPALLPPSLAAMMHPKAVLEFLLSPESSTLPLDVAEEAAAAWKKEENDDVPFNHLSQDPAFRTTVAVLGRMKRKHKAALLKRKKKLWALTTAAAAWHQSSRDALPVASMGSDDDVFVVLPPQ